VPGSSREDRRGGLVETSLLEAVTDFQFEVLTTHLNDGGKLPDRSKLGNGHAYLGAPYGIYRTSDNWLAIAMNPLDKLADLLNIPLLRDVSRSDTFARRDELKRILADRLATQSTDHWLSILEPADIWCAPVLDWPKLLQHEASKCWARPLHHQQRRNDMQSLACPIRVDGERRCTIRGHLKLDCTAESIAEEFNL
jgi:crotonobetainyl-CoA:carnitine CoA-transferase CaiB-like acyl-CoA transferase